MILYILDTDIASYVIRKKPLSVLEMMQAKAERGDHITISVITYSELLLGVERSGNRRKHRNLVNGFVERLDDVLSWDNKAAEAYARLQMDLYKKGTPIGPNDTMIAGHALSLNATMVTNNLKHFNKVPRLKVENWVADE